MRFFLFWGLRARYNDVLCFIFIFSENPVTKRTVTFMLRTFSSNYAKKRKMVLCYPCVQEVVFNLGNRTYQSTRTCKRFWNEIRKQNVFTVPGLESEIWQNVRFRPIIYTTCQNLNWKKTRVTNNFEIKFLFVRFLFVLWFRKS